MSLDNAGYDETHIYIDPNDAFNADVTWSTLPFGEYQSQYVKGTRVQMRLNAIAEAIELRDFDAALLMSKNPI